MSRHALCSYCHKEMRTNEMVKCTVGEVERILCTKCACFLMLDELERVKKWMRYVNDFMGKTFPKEKKSAWEGIGKI